MIVNNCKVLIVEDDHSLRLSLTAFLKNHHFQVSNAQNGEEGLLLCKHDPFDIIVTDIRMPLMNGIQFIRNLPENQKSAIRIIMTGEANIQELAETYSQGIDDVIIKPMPKIQILLDTIFRQMDKQQRLRQTAFQHFINYSHKQILKILTINQDIDLLLEYIFSILVEMLSLDRMDFFLKNQDQGFFITQSFLKTNSTQISLKKKIIQSDFEDTFKVSNTPLFINNLKEYPIHSKKMTQYLNGHTTLEDQALIILPLSEEGLKFGYILLFSNTHSISKEHIKLFREIIPNISQSIKKNIEHGLLQEENRNLNQNINTLNQEIIEQQDSLIFSLAELAEKRDLETWKHLLRIQKYAKIIATEFFKEQELIDIGYGLKRRDQIIDMIYKTSPLHDIGKVAIPDSILFKPGKLDENEFTIMQKHTLFGSDCLLRASQRVANSELLKMAMDIAKYHHEKWNGTGYPEGLNEDQIPLAARIVSIADVYDALRSKRYYKEAWSHTSATDFIVKQSNLQFDPSLVEIFSANHLSFDEIFNSLSHSES